LKSKVKLAGHRVKEKSKLTGQPPREIGKRSLIRERACFNFFRGDPCPPMKIGNWEQEESRPKLKKWCLRWEEKTQKEIGGTPGEGGRESNYGLKLKHKYAGEKWEDKE